MLRLRPALPGLGDSIRLPDLLAGVVGRGRGGGGGGSSEGAAASEAGEGHGRAAGRLVVVVVRVGEEEHRRSSAVSTVGGLGVNGDHNKGIKGCRRSRDRSRVDVVTLGFAAPLLSGLRFAALVYKPLSLSLAL